MRKERNKHFAEESKQLNCILQLKQHILLYVSKLQPHQPKVYLGLDGGGGGELLLGEGGGGVLGLLVFVSSSPVVAF